jgi:hypothetical protein
MSLGNISALGEVDPSLSADVALFRSRLEIPYYTADVMVNPQADSYEPIISKTGLVRLGQVGVEDFKDKFGFIEDLDPVRLIAVYSVVKHGLRSRRDASMAFDQRLREVTHEVMPALPEHLHEGRTNKAIDLVIGRLSTVCAVKRAAFGLPQPLARRLPGQLISTAEKKNTNLKGTEYQDAQKEVMAHFSLSIGGNEDSLICGLVTSHRRK